MQSKYAKLMRKCISLAKKGEGKVSPNPLVGAVIFDDEFNIISQGWHEKYGTNHAERNAILNAKEELKGKSIIVNLEPCSHYGKTPPCADLIIEKGIKKVIIGMIDPNKIVRGNGIKKLQSAGIEVITGVLEEDCKRLNEIFIKNHLTSMPFVTLKTAMTIDGKIASRTGNSKWITDETSRYYVHKMRNKYDAILTGSATVIADNPSLTCRIKNGRNPIRIILDTNLNTPINSKVYNDESSKVFIFTSELTSNEKIKKYPQHVKIIKSPLKNNLIDLKHVLNCVFNEGVRSIMVEAGGKINNSFIQEKLADKLVCFTAPKIISDKEAINFSHGCVRENISDCNNLKILSTKKLKNDIIIVSYFV